MYSYNTAGPFGLEDQVSTSGPGMALIYQLLIPFFWCIPISLVAAELTTAMPVEGGFYRWTRVAFGDFWGFLAGWWNWCASFLLGALYAVLFTDYMTFYFPGLVGWKHYLMAVAVIALITYVNVRGIRVVGTVATALELAVLAAVLLMCVMSVRMWHYNPFLPIIPPHRPIFQVFGVGFSLGLWLYAGYEQVSSVAEEVEESADEVIRGRWRGWYRYRLRLMFLPTACSLAAVGNWEHWSTGYFSQAAQLIGGPVLGFIITVAAAVMNLSILNSTVLTTTRMPSAMAEDGYLVSVPCAHTSTIRNAVDRNSAVRSDLLRAWPRYNVVQLISVYVWLRIATSVLTVLSAWQITKQAAGAAAQLSHSLGKCRAWLTQ